MRNYKLKDLVGTRIKFITVTSRFEPRDTDTALSAKWNVQCDCGGVAVFNHKDLTSKKKRTCGCGFSTMRYQPGNRYGLLTVVSEGPRNSYANKRQVWCKCDCGNTELTLVTTNNLVSGNTSSCGCVGEESRKTHGMSNTRTYQIHEGMIRRCKPHLAEDFPYHAGKGITVCEEWKVFENFFADMGECPDGMSLDRIDVNGNYCKENCRWATNSVQGYNKGLDPNNTSGKSGVSFYTLQGKWSAEIHVENQHIRLGMFYNFEDAVKAREEAELKYYGWNKQ
jgi:hypothetical protein